MSRHTWNACILIVLLTLGSHAGARAPEPGLQFLQAGELKDAPMLNADIDIHVSGLIARARIRQTFRNDSPDWIEAIYRFPLPEDAAVDRLRIRVGGRLIEGEIQERAEAQKTYQAAKAAGKKTSLVQQSRANLFSSRIANIGPGETIDVEIEYQELVEFEQNAFRLRVPLTMTERYVPRGLDRGLAMLATNGVASPVVRSSNGHRLKLDVFIEAGVQLDLIASRYHTVSIDRESGRYHVALVDDAVVLDRDFELTWQPTAASEPRAMSFSEMRDGEPYYVVMLMPPDEQTAPLRMPRETIFIIDTSGSMHGESIQQAQKALIRAFDSLQAGDLFNVVEFNSVTRPLFDQSQPADSVQKSQAVRFVSRLAANGGTEMSPALSFALNSPASELHLRQVVFVTDGSVSNEEALFQQIEQTLGQARFFTVGIGSAPNSWFMRKSAEIGRGAFTMISAAQEVEEKMDRLLEKIESPQLNNIQVQWPANGDVEMYPAVVPDLYLGEPVLLRFRADAVPQAPLVVTGEQPGGAWTAELSLDDAFDDFGVGALWARAKIDALFDEQRRGADRQAIRSQVIDTALTHRIVSRYTSLVAVDKTPTRMPETDMISREVPSLLPKGQLAGFPATASNAAALRVIAALLFLFAGLLYLRARRSHVPTHS